MQIADVTRKSSSLTTTTTTTTDVLTLLIDCRKMFFKAHLLAHINYASTLWSNASEVHIKKNKKKLNSVYIRAAKLTLPEQSLSTTAKLRKLDNLPLQKQFMYYTAVLMFRVHMGLTPGYVSDLLNRAPVQYGLNNYVLPQTRNYLYKTSFAFFLGHQSGTLSLRKWKRTSLCVVLRLICARFSWTNSIMLR